MNFPIPDFVPVPSAEIMQTISIVLLFVGICLVGMGVFLVSEQEKRERKPQPYGLS